MREVVNGEYRSLASRLQGQRSKVVLAEMYGADGLQLDDMTDDAHPDDRGYGKMATTLYKALVQATQKGWLQRRTLWAPGMMEVLEDDCTLLDIFLGHVWWVS